MTKLSQVPVSESQQEVEALESAASPLPAVVVMNKIPVNLEKGDKAPELRKMNTGIPSKRDQDRRPEGPGRPFPVPQTAVQKRISGAKKWQDIRAIVERQPAGFDALAAAAALSRLSELYPEGLQFIEDPAPQRRRGPTESVDAGSDIEAALPASEAAEQLTTELMSLLQLQLPRLPASYLAEALGAAGKLGAAAPRSAWLLSAMGAVQSRMSRCGAFHSNALRT
jgi:hypothetical protein